MAKTAVRTRASPAALPCRMMRIAATGFDLLQYPKVSLDNRLSAASQRQDATERQSQLTKERLPAANDATTWTKLGEEPHWLCAAKNIPNQPQVDSKHNKCRKEANPEQNTVFLEIPERDQCDQNGGKDVAEWNRH